MKTKVLLAVTLLAGLAASAQAASIVGTKHDLSSKNPNLTASSIHSTTQNQTCVFCHAPHNSITTKLLWNRSYTQGSTIQIYTSYNSLAVRNAVTTRTTMEEGSSSLLCLSCHALASAGEVITNTANNKGGSVGTNPGTGLWTDGGIAGTPGTGATGGMTNLTNDHPVNINYSKVYDAAKTSFVQKATGATVGKLRLFGTSGEIMECASCHNVHDNSNTKFLAISNDKSALCVECHSK